ncbi:hypothetical protein K439DRAFT_1415439 [Ramaria rubella]|nr:hypothetical protein K439DRAFT_1415439 [Ramaria rubella]
MFNRKSGGSLASKIAHTTTLPALGNKDLKLLQDLITNEKMVLTTLQKLAVDFTRASESLKNWGLGEGEDLGDVLSHATGIYAHITTALNNFANHEHTVRAHLKSIRSREEKLDELKRKRKSVAAKADAADKKLAKMSGENKNLPAQTELLTKLRDEIRQLDTEIMVEEARLSDFKRMSTRNFMALKLGGLLEFGEKATIVGELGKLLIEEIPLEPTPPGQPRAFYQSHPKTENLSAEVSRCIGEVVFSAPSEMNENGETSTLMNHPSEDVQQFQQQQLQPSQMQHPPLPADYGTLSSPDVRVVNPTPSAPQVMESEFGGGAGVMQRFGTGPMSVSVRSEDGGVGGGRFNTFPVKTRSNTVLSAGSGTGDDSFSASVVDALRQNEGGDDKTWDPSPPAVNVGDNPWNGDEYGGSHVRNASQDSTQVPYAATAPYQQPTPALAPEKGVRFRTPSMEVSGMSPVAPGAGSPMYPHSGSGWAGRGAGSHVSAYDAPVSPTQPDIPEDDREYDPYDSYHEPMSPQDEQERNAAAAREVAREMDALQFAPPLLPPSQTQTYQPSPPTTAPLSIVRSTSPFQPPQAPYAQSHGRSPGRSDGSLNSLLPRSSDMTITTTATPYATPPEYPSERLPSPNTGSSASGAPRTITAAAFKRPGRLGSDADLTKKRLLPSSPHPVRTSPVLGGVGLNQSQNSPLQERAGIPAGAQPPDYFPPSKEPGSPDLSDYGALGNVRVVNSHEEGGLASPGYNQSQFVTNLED